MTLIYILEKNGVPFYVGKTKEVSSKGRFNAHKRKFECDIFILDKIQTYEWKFWEKHYISLFKSWGFKLENKNEGGGGLTTFISSKERNIKISNSTKGRIISEETKKRISECNRGHKRNSGRIQSKETKEKIKHLAKDRKVSEETKLKKSLAMRGKKHSEETKNKMRMAALGKSKSETHKENMRKNRLPIIEGVKQSNSKSIFQFDLQKNFIKEWPSITEAKKHTHGDINACCSGRQKSAGGFYWEYKKV